MPDHLARPHPVVVDWIIQRQRQVENREEIYDPTLKRYILPTPLGDADLRRLLIEDALCKLLEMKGATIKRVARDNLEVTHGNISIEIHIGYRLKCGQCDITEGELLWRSSDTQTSEHELYETGTLLIAILSRLPKPMKSEWRDTTEVSIEKQLNGILDGVMSAFLALEERKLDDARFQRFLQYAADWREARIARSFLASLRSRLPQGAGTIDGIEIADWLAWAERKIAEHGRLTDDPLSILRSIAEVTDRSSHPRHRTEGGH